MKNAILLLLPATLLFSCGNESAVQEKTTDRVVLLQPDTLKSDSINPNLIAFVLGGDTISPKEAASILYRFDEDLIRDTITPLSVKETQAMFPQLDSACDHFAQTTLARFYYLDSMNRAGNDSYLDLGQIVKVEIRLLDTIAFSEAFATVVWSMHYATYEACPYSAGTYYMLSNFDKKGNLISSQLMGKQTGGGDAPYSFTETGISNLFVDGSFKTMERDTSTDGDAPKKTQHEITKYAWRGAITKEGKILREQLELK
jgi:hypothetical protein